MHTNIVRYNNFYSNDILCEEDRGMAWKYIAKGVCYGKCGQKEFISGRKIGEDRCLCFCWDYVEIFIQTGYKEGEEERRL